MIKVLFTVFLLLITLDARENPFFPTAGEKDLLVALNQDRSIPSLTRASISLPNQARVIQKVSIEYKNLDGSVDTKSIKLKNSVDWHLPIFISQNYAEGLKKEDIPSNIKKEYKEIASIKYATFFSFEKKLKIVTNDKIIRNFLLVNPHRIVLDFKKDTNMQSYTKVTKKNIFKKIRVGNHAGYYRVVIELDGVYTYNMKMLDYGYIFRLN